MAINRDFIGVTKPPSAPYQVSREKIREFATAIGDTNPVYHDVDAARKLGHPDLVAPPTLAFIVTYKAMVATMSDPTLGLDYSRVVHGEQSFKYRRPLYAGDEIVVESTIDDIRAIGSNELMDLRQDVKTIDGELIATTKNVTVSRGTAATDEEG